MKTIAALITVHNRREKTLQCLRNLFSQNLPDGYTLDVFLTDDGCTDGTGDAVKKQFPEVNIIHGSGNLFWNRGMYLAWKNAAQKKDYDFYLWLNDDTFLITDAISKLLHTSEDKINKAIIVGTTCAFNDDKKLTYGGRIKNGEIVFAEKEPVLCNYFNGNIVLIPREVYQKAGTNNPVFRHALGDFDYGLRASALGIESFVSPGISGQCDEHDKLAAWCNPNQPFKKRWKSFRSPAGQNPEEFFIFGKRHYGLYQACFHYFTNYLRVFCPGLWKNKSQL